jgi:diguanylate cyclase (GGDEF)-like protein
MPINKGPATNSMQVTNRAILYRKSPLSQNILYLTLITSALVLIALLDHATGDVPFQHLYYLPIIVAATQFGFLGGLTVSLVSVVLYHLSNPGLLNSHKVFEADIVQSVLFITVGLVAAKLAQDAKRLHLLSITDDLTGLHNLRSFESHLENMVTQAKRDGSFLSVLVVDVDRLKSLNDSYGHLAGADAVRTVGELIGSQISGRSVACRYGGDEFVVAIPDCGREQAVEIAGRLCRSISNARPVLARQAFPIGSLSISVGTASRRIASDADPLKAGEELFHSADKALYRAKGMGRNGVSTDHGVMQVELDTTGFSRVEFQLQPSTANDDTEDTTGF